MTLENPQPASPSRRFIAAARCPSCQREDTLYFVEEIGGDFACIECGYTSNNASHNEAVALKILDAQVAQVTQAKQDKSQVTTKGVAEVSTQVDQETQEIHEIQQEAKQGKVKLQVI